MTVDAIKAAIDELPEADRRKLVDQLVALAEDEWDGEMERDFSAGGRGHRLVEEINQQIDRGNSLPWTGEYLGVSGIEVPVSRLTKFLGST